MQRGAGREHTSQHRQINSYFHTQILFLMVIKNEVILTVSLKFIQNELINVDYYFFEIINKSKILANFGFIFIFPIYLKKTIYFFLFLSIFMLPMKPFTD